MYQSPFGIIGGLGLGIDPITDEQWGTRWYGQGFGNEVFPLEDAPLQWRGDYPDQVWQPPARRRLGSLSTWTTAWPSVVPAPPAVPALIAISTERPVRRRARSTLRPSLSEDLSWDLIGVATARYPSQFPRSWRTFSGGVTPLEPPTPATPLVSSWYSASTAVVRPVEPSGIMSYQAWGGPVDIPPVGAPALSWRGVAPDRLDRRLGRTLGSGLLDPLPLGTVLLDWRGMAPDRLPRRLPPTTLGGTIDPAPLGTVLLEWIGVRLDVVRPRRSPVTTGAYDPLPLGTVLLEWLPFAWTLPGRRRVGRLEPVLLTPGDVTAPGAPTDWRGSQPDWLTTTRRDAGGPAAVTDPTTPAAPVVFAGGPQFDRPPAPRSSIAWLTRGAVGSAAIDLSVTTRPSFGGQQIPGWRTMQYTGLVGSLFAEALVATPQVLLWPQDRIDRRRAFLAAITTRQTGLVDTPPPVAPVAWYPRIGGGLGRYVWAVVASGASAHTDGARLGDLTFTASPDHATLVQYRARRYAAAAPTILLSEQDLGRPAPDGNQQIRVNIASWLNLAAPGVYLVAVLAVGPSGSTESAPSNTFTVPLA